MELITPLGQGVTHNSLLLLSIVFCEIDLNKVDRCDIYVCRDLILARLDNPETLRFGPSPCGIETKTTKISP